MISSPRSSSRPKRGRGKPDQIFIEISTTYASRAGEGVESEGTAKAPIRITIIPEKRSLYQCLAYRYTHFNDIMGLQLGKRPLGEISPAKNDRNSNMISWVCRSNPLNARILIMIGGRQMYIFDIFDKSLKSLIKKLCKGLCTMFQRTSTRNSL
jgi:hypothetical protein